MPCCKERLESLFKDQGSADALLEVAKMLVDIKYGDELFNAYWEAMLREGMNGTMHERERRAFMAGFLVGIKARGF